MGTSSKDAIILPNLHPFFEPQAQDRLYIAMCPCGLLDSHLSEFGWQHR